MRAVVRPRGGDIQTGAAGQPAVDAYLCRRAEIEIERAQQALHPDAVRAHCPTAGLYLDHFYSGRVPVLGEPMQSGDGEYLPGDGTREWLPGEQP